MKRKIAMLLSSVMVISGCCNVMAYESDNADEVSISADEADDVSEKADIDGFDENAADVADDIIVSESAIDVSRAVSLYAVSSGDWEYETTSGGIEITGYTGSDREITIPSVINGLTVVEVGYRVFYNNKTITSVTIPETVTTIDYEAFRSCTALRSVNIPSSVTSIGSYAFSGCSSLRTISIPASVSSFGIGAFANCISLASVKIYCGSIGSSAFYGCTSLSEIEFGPNVSEIDSSAFSSCTALTNLSLGSGTTMIYGSAFSNCTALSTVSFNEGLVQINDSAFYNCTSLKSVTMPSTVVLIGSAFEGCKSLEKAVLNEGLTTLSGRTFKDCISLTSVNVPNTLITMGSYTFDGCTSLAEITMGDNLKTIGSYAFNNCTGLKTVNINNTLTTIESYAFYNCKSLSSINIPFSVKKINDYTFYGCTSMTEVTIPNSIESIGRCAFSGCTGLKSITIPSSTTDIGYCAFNGCSSLSSITFNEGLINMDNSFGNCTALTNVVMPSTLRDMTGAFYGCTALESVTLNEGLTNGSSAFSGCKSLKEVTVPSTVTSNSNMFNGCTSLVKADVNSAVVGTSMFYGCLALEDVTLGNNITAINNSAFYNCGSLRKLQLSDNIVTIGNDAFSGSGISDIQLNKNLTSIGSNAFHSCKSLMTIVIPEKVTSIGSNAFQSSGVTSAIFEGKPPTSFGSYVFSNTSGTSLFYKNAEGWTSKFNGYNCYPYPTANPSMTISNVSRTGFDIDITGVDLAYPMVKIAVWSDANGQDDILYYDNAINYNADTNTTSIGTQKILTEKHGDSTGKYNIAVYYGSTAGNMGGVILSGSCDVPLYYTSDKPVIGTSPVEGGYSVTITPPAEGVAVYYTTDGSEPSERSTLYTGTFIVSENTTVKAVTVREGYYNSEAAVEEITVEKLSSPELSMKTAPGGYEITAVSDTEGVNIYYTTDGTEPTPESTLYEGPFVVYNNSAVKAIAAKAGMANSDAAEISVIFTGDEPVLVIDDVKGIAGDYIDVPVRIVNNPGIASFALSISYDSTKLTPVSYTAGDEYSTMLSNMDQNVNSSPLRFQWDNMSDVKTDGIIFTIRFAVVKGQPSSDSEITISYNNEDICNFELENINPRIDNGNVAITYVKKGDMSNDGAIAARDVLMLRRIVAGYGSELTDEERYAADVFADGIINNKDVLLIRQYVAGYDVTLE